MVVSIFSTEKVIQTRIPLMVLVLFKKNPNHEPKGCNSHFSKYSNPWTRRHLWKACLPRRWKSRKAISIRNTHCKARTSAAVTLQPHCLHWLIVQVIYLFTLCWLFLRSLEEFVQVRNKNGTQSIEFCHRNKYQQLPTKSLKLLKYQIATLESIKVLIASSYVKYTSSLFYLQEVALEKFRVS